MTVYENVKDLPEDQRQHFIWDRVIYANPIKATETLEQLDPYKPLVTYDNHEEVIKIARHAPHAGLVLRLGVPNTGSTVELSSKFGALPAEAVDLIAFARNNKLEVEGLSFHVGSQCTNIQNYIQALHLASSVFSEAATRGFELKLLDIGGGFPAHYDDTSRPSASWPERSIRNWTACFRIRLRFSRNLVDSSWPPPPLPLLRLSARRFAAGSCATT